jgi:hypothetical protein
MNYYALSIGTIAPQMRLPQFHSRLVKSDLRNQACEVLREVNRTRCDEFDERIFCGGRISRNAVRRF